MMKFKKSKDKSPPTVEGFRLVFRNETEGINYHFGFEMKPFHRDYDLNVAKHDKIIRQLEGKLPLTIKGVRRFHVEVVKQDITNLCEKALHMIGADLDTVRLVIETSSQNMSRRKKQKDI